MQESNEKNAKYVYDPLFLMIATSYVVIIPVAQELSQHTLYVIQGFVLDPKSLLLCLHSPTEIIIIIVSHVGRYEPCSHRADSS